MKPQSPRGKEQEIEVKVHVPKITALRKRLRQIGAQRICRVHEMNVAYDTLEKAFLRRGCLVRVRTEVRAGKRRQRPNVILTFKGPSAGAPTGYKVRMESETSVTNPTAIEAILYGIGLRPWFHYEKYRTRYALPRRCRWASGLHLDLDETPIGVYLEFEGPRRAIDRAARLLGYAPAVYITASYWGLYVENCRQKGVPARNMLFPPKK